MMRQRIEFDPNVRHHGFASVLNDPAWQLGIAQPVTVFEPEEGIEAPATVSGFWGKDNKYVLLQVDWAAQSQSETPDA